MIHVNFTNLLCNVVARADSETLHKGFITYHQPLLRYHLGCNSLSLLGLHAQQLPQVVQANIVVEAGSSQQIVLRDSLFKNSHAIGCDGLLVFSERLGKRIHLQRSS